MATWEQMKAMTTRERNEDMLKSIQPITEAVQGLFSVGELVTVISVFGPAWKHATILEIPMEGWRILNTVDNEWVVRKVTDLTYDLNYQPDLKDAES